MTSDAPQAIVNSSDDEDLKLALALSLQDSPGSAKTSPAKPQSKQPVSNNQELVALDSDEDDDNLDLPSRVSKPESEAGERLEYAPVVGIGSSIFTRPHSDMSNKGLNAKGSANGNGGSRRDAISRTKQQSIKAPTAAARGMLGMDRAAMEAERLARMGKRKAPISPPPLRQDQKRSNNGNTPPGKKKIKGSEPAVPQTPSPARSPPDLEIFESGPQSNVNKEREKISLISPQHEEQSDPEVLRSKKGKGGETPNSQTLHSQISDPDVEVVASKSSPKKIKEATSATSQASLLPKPSPDFVILPNKPQTYTTPKLTGLTFPHGTVLKTWALGHERSNDIKIEEVLQRNTLKLAVISSFQWDMEWLHSKINCGSTKLVFVMQAKGEKQKARYREETKDASSYLRLCFPPMEQMVNCMHSKLMLLSHLEYLRVVVPTANCTPYDWGETRPATVMENSVFVVDLPRLSEGKRVKLEDMTDFGRELIYFVAAMGLQKEIVESLYAFDFSATNGLAFVHTIGGAHTGQAWRRTGYCGLGRAVRELGLTTDMELDIDYIASSIGAINRDFLAALYLAAQGDDGMREYTSRYRATNPGVWPRLRDGQVSNSLSPAFLESLDERFRLFFPSEDTVVSSKGGKDCAGVICFQEKWWRGANFPRKAFRDCKSRREGLLMHNKVCSLNN